MSAHTGGTLAVDVLTEIVIDRPIEVVGAYAGDPSRAPTWYVNIDAAEWRSDAGVRVGSRIACIARFLGRRLDHTYEIVEFVPERRLVMQTAEGPFPMEAQR